MDLMEENVCVIGKAIEIDGNVTGSGKLVVLGQIKGQVSLADMLMVERGGVVLANVNSREVNIQGTLEGDIIAMVRVTIATTGDTKGNIQAPEVEIADGARFNGRLDMELDLPAELLN